MFLITGIIAILTVSFGKDYFAKIQSESIFRQLDSAKIDQKDEIAQRLAGQNESGIKLLVHGLTSKNEATALACHRALQELLAAWKSQPNGDVASHYLSLSTKLAENLKSSNSSYSLNLTHDLARQMQTDISDRGIADQRLVSENCRKIVDAWQVGQVTPTLAAERNRQSVFAATLPGAGEPRNARVAGINVPYLTAEQIDVTPEGRLRQLAEVRGDFYAQNSQNENQITNQATRQPAADTEKSTMPRVGFHSLHSSAAASAGRDRVLIARKETPEPVALQEETSPFLERRLREMAAIDLPKLPTQDLMRLLNHENWEISQKSESILKKRDGFQDEHVQLASKLYHPAVDVRKSILPQLAADHELETASWLSELLQDPDASVRLAAANAVCYQIPLDAVTLAQLTNLMQSDDDRRIAEIARQLENKIAAETDPARFPR